MSDESKRKRNETPEFSTQDLGKRLRQILEDVNAYQVILRRMDGTTIISLPALIALGALAASVHSDPETAEDTSIPR